MVNIPLVRRLEEEIEAWRDFLSSLVLNRAMLADTLNGLSPGLDFEWRKAIAKNSGLVIVSMEDGCVFLAGAITGEFMLDDGEQLFFLDKELLWNECDESQCCPYFEKLTRRAYCITLDTTSVDTFKTDIPHSTFDLMEQGEIYSRGIVFSLADIDGEQREK